MQKLRGRCPGCASRTTCWIFPAATARRQSAQAYHRRRVSGTGGAGKAEPVPGSPAHRLLAFIYPPTSRLTDGLSTGFAADGSVSPAGGEFQMLLVRNNPRSRHLFWRSALRGARAKPGSSTPSSTTSGPRRRRWPPSAAPIKCNEKNRRPSDHQQGGRPSILKIKSICPAGRPLAPAPMVEYLVVKVVVVAQRRRISISDAPPASRLIPTRKTDRPIPSARQPGGQS